MTLFNGISPASGNATIEAACKALVAHVQSLRLTVKEWSLAELHLMPEDFQWLQQWVQHLDDRTLRDWLPPEGAATLSQSQRIRQTYLGSLLLLFAAEYARRALPREGEWTIPIQYCFGPTARPLLFANGEPSPQHLKALRQAATTLKLRQAELARGTAGGFNEFLGLQTGLTATHVEEQLPQWFADASLPAFIEALLAPHRGSRTFQELWWCCRLFRDREISAVIFSQLLAVNPWVLPEWHEQIITALTTLPAANTPRNTIPPAPPIATNRPTPETFPLPFLDIFGALDAEDSSPATIADAVRAINVRADERRLGRERWSLAELQPSDYDFIWLRVWVKKLEAATVREYLNEEAKFQTNAGLVKYGEALGCLLLLWLSETARRNAVEGELWPYVAEGHFEGEAQSLLFTQGQPSPALREMLQATVERFHLRNVLNDTGTQRWVNTVFLQFGFTRRGFRQRLPDWLAGQMPPAVAALLHQPEGSLTFRQLWRDLSAYRFGQVSKEELRRKLEDDAWILPEWADDLLVLASASPPALDEQAAAPPDSFLAPPVLRWYEGGSPHFISQIASDLSALNLTDSHYDLRIGGQAKERLLRQADDSYLPVQSRVIVIPFDQPSVTASLVNRQGETVASCDLELWPPDEDVAIFKLSTGERLPDAFTAALSPNTAYALLTAADLDVKPESPEWQLANSGLVKLHRLQPGWPAGLNVLLDDELLWQPNRQVPTPVWPNQVRIFAPERPVKWGREFQVKIIHPLDVEVRYVRCRGRALELVKQGTAEMLAGPLVVTPELDVNKLDFRIGLQKTGQRCTLKRRVELKVIGAAHLTVNGWRALNKRSRLTVEQARRDRFKLVTPRIWGTQNLNANELLLFEGDGIHHARPRQAGPLGHLNGWGAPLRARQFFNFKPGAPSLSIAGSVINHGVIEDVVCETLPDSTARLLRIRFREYIASDSQYRVIWWDASGELIALTTKTSDGAEDAWWWACELPDACTQPVAVAIAFNGERLGAWWPQDDWLQSLPGQTEQKAESVAALLRWFHLPLLSRDAVAALQPLMAQHSAAFLRAWLLDTGLPDELRQQPRDEVWLAVARTLLHNWRPNAESARQALLALAEVDDDDELTQALPDAAKHLLAVDPLLLAKVLRVWKHRQRSALLTSLQSEFAGSWNANSVNQRKQELISSIAQQFQLAPTFITAGLLTRATQALQQTTLDPVHENNLAVAARIPSMRLLLALHLLGNI